MANEFMGFLIKNSQGNIIDKYIQIGTYSSNPNQREEIVAYRDDNTRDLSRVTAQGTKTSINFSTLPLNLDQKIAFQEFFNETMIDKLQRKISITYWDDENNTYKSGYFYVANFPFTIKSINETTINYEPLEISLVEY